MSFSFDPTLSTPGDRVRFEIGDVDEASAYLSDEEIAALLSVYGDDVLRAAGAAAEGIAVRFGRLADVSVGDVRVGFAAVRDSFEKLALRLAARTAGPVAPMPFAGGISASDKAARAGDGDAVAPAFAKSAAFRLPARFGGEPW